MGDRAVASRAQLPPRLGLGQAHLRPLGSGTQAGAHLAAALCPPTFMAQAPSSWSVPACSIAGDREVLTAGPMKGLWTPAWQQGQPSSLELVYAGAQLLHRVPPSERRGD